MTAEGLQLLEEFLKRADIKGSEVPAFNKVLVELQEEYKSLTEVKEPKEVIPPKPKK